MKICDFVNIGKGLITFYPNDTSKLYNGNPFIDIVDFKKHDESMPFFLILILYGIYNSKKHTNLNCINVFLLDISRRVERGKLC